MTASEITSGLVEYGTAIAPAFSVVAYLGFVVAVVLVVAHMVREAFTVRREPGDEA